MGIAGLWQRWHDPQTGQIIPSFTMLTINADHHAVMMRMHKPSDEKRTPVVLASQNFNRWLQADPVDAAAMLSLDQMPELIARPALNNVAPQ